jgi:predicted O-linked N-acetylglucosamine transferase (SPINDLY family)
MFDIWMRLLQKVEGSVLWMNCSDAGAMARLKKEAAARGVAPKRLVFARFKERVEDHLARHRLADLFLDTLPYNAHSTAADALWTGLPVLTCLGRAFQARVAAGLLRAIGLPELVTTSLAEYEEQAFALARDPQRLAAIREKLARNRDTTPLFDSAGFTRGLEAVYRNMWERQQAGLPPESFSVSQ